MFSAVHYVLLRAQGQSNPQFVLVIIGYAEKLHKEKLVKAVYKMHEHYKQEHGLPELVAKNKFNFRLAAEEVTKDNHQVIAVRSYALKHG